MKTRVPVLGLLAHSALLGCGASAATMPVEEPSREPAGEPSREGAVTQSVPETLDWLSNDEVRCARGMPEPDGPVIAGDGTSVAVRARSIAFEREGDARIVCEAREDAAGQLVLVIEGYDGVSIGRLEGDRLHIGAEARDVVRLPDATSITAARLVHYCPDGATDCVIVGSLAAVEAYADSDPDGPRSGWDVTTRLLTPSRLRRAGTQWLGGRSCGLELGLRGAPRGLDCAGAVLEERLSCIAREAAAREDELYDAGSDQELAQMRAALERDAAAFRVVLTDGRQEVTFSAFEVASLACVDGHVLLGQRAREFSSDRGYGAVSLHEGRIVGGHWMSIRDHEEARSECGNAWDGVQLVPVLREGVVIGGLVLGAGGRPLFEVERGDVGDVRTPAFWPGENGDAPRELEEAAFAYGDEQVPVALRETPQGLLAIGSGTPAAVCSLVVNDRDGQTNVRPNASAGREPVGTLPNGTVIVPVEQRGRWYRIETPTRGWVYAANLDRRCATP